MSLNKISLITFHILTIFPQDTFLYRLRFVAFRCEISQHFPPQVDTPMRVKYTAHLSLHIQSP
jgi:hypothetical protein